MTDNQGIRYIGICIDCDSGLSDEPTEQGNTANHYMAQRWPGHLIESIEDGETLETGEACDGCGSKVYGLRIPAVAIPDEMFASKYRDEMEYGK